MNTNRILRKTRLNRDEDGIFKTLMSYYHISEKDLLKNLVVSAGTALKNMLEKKEKEAVQVEKVESETTKVEG